MPLDAAALNEKLAPLKAKYLTHLREARQEIVDFQAACEKGAITPHQRDAMRQRAHKLTGSGKTYGFSDISEAARLLENALDNAVQPDALSSFATALLAACDHAMTAPASAPSASMVKELPIQSATAKKPLLIAADDDPIMRAAIANLFSQEAEVMTTSNGKEALRLIEERKPDLVILDDIMPEMTGRKVLEILRSNPELAVIPVVMITASNSEKDIMHGLMEGAADYITKPFNPNVVVTRCLQLLRHKHRKE